MTDFDYKFSCETAPYKTFSSIIKADETKQFLPFINFIDSLFDSSKEHDVNTLYEIIDRYLMGFSDKSDQYPLSFCIYSLFRFALVKPKQRQLFIDILLLLIEKMPNNALYINSLIKSCKKYMEKSFPIFSYLFENPKDYERFVFTGKSENIQEFVSLFPKDSLLSYLRDDDINSLKNYITTIPDFSFTDCLKTDRIYPFFNYLPSHLTNINISAYFGAINCFKFFTANYQVEFQKEIAYFAIDGGNFAIIQLLCQENVSFDNCFTFATICNNNNIADWLLSNYSVNFILIHATICYCNYRAFLFQVLNGQILDPNINNGLDNLNNFDTSLSNICQYPSINIDIIKFFKEKGYDLNQNCLYGICNSPQKSLDIIKYIVENGVNINKCKYIDANRETPLCALCSQDNPDFEAIKYLIDHGADVNLGTYTPLHALCAKPEPPIDIIKYLIEKGANVNKISADRGFHPKQVTPFAIVCSNPKINFDLINYFIEKGADINKGEYTPLYHVCKCNGNSFNTDLFDFLINKKADINKGELPPLEAAVNSDYSNKIDLIKLLLNKGASINLLYTYNRKIVSVLYMYLDHPNPNIDIVKLFLSNNADINAGKYTPLFAACYNPKCSEEIIRYLLENGANPNMGNNTPLYALCKNNQNIELARLLLKHGADPLAGNISAYDCVMSNPPDDPEFGELFDTFDPEEEDEEEED